jgi:hypothetical protein
MKKFKSPLKIKDYEERIIGLKGRNYHLHVQDLIDGMVPIEMEMLQELCKILGVDYAKLKQETCFLALEYIFNKVQDIYKK